MDKKLDRRIQRTRQLLRDALMALVVEMGWEPITIQDITDRANVSRTTFYLHFRDKDDLLFSSMEEVYDELAAQFEPKTPDLLVKQMLPSTDGMGASEFTHVAQYADFYRMMLSSRGSAAFILRVQKYLADVFLTKSLIHLHNPQTGTRVPLDAVAAYYAGAEIGVIRWWLDGGLQQTPHEMEQIVWELCRSGIFMLMGVDPAALPEPSRAQPAGS